MHILSGDVDGVSRQCEAQAPHVTVHGCVRNDRLFYNQWLCICGVSTAAQGYLVVSSEKSCIMSVILSSASC